MKLIHKTKLFFKEGNSDKVYEIDLCELSPDKYLVNFRYGRRGSALKEGTKTPDALPRGQAEALFAELENEKRRKGYQTETEVFIELPSLEAVDVQSAKGAILHRLQDALTGGNTFKTEWKTSRVIWKAGVLHIEEAIPLIIKLASKGDEMQLYCALYALIQLKATQAAPLFTSYATNTRQKNHIRNLAWEGLLSVSPDGLETPLLEQLPETLRYAVETDDDALVTKYLAQDISEGRVAHLPTLYLLCRIRPWLLPALVENLPLCPFKPPYFKQIRAIYRLAQLRRDTGILSALSYRFEKEGAMFNRTEPLAELKSDDSTLAFSDATKKYFQKNSVEYLRGSGRDGDAKPYLKLAMATLLQYTEADFTPGGERVLESYGQYNSHSRKYTFTLVDYPACADSLLLSTILFGNDPTRKLQRNLSFIIGKRTVTSTKYYYTPGEVEVVETKAPAPVKSQPAASPSIVDAAVNVFKSFFGKKTIPPPAPAPAPPKEIAAPPPPPASPRTELYPDYWDTLPEAYVQLLMQARMNIIHRFAFDNLKAHPHLGEIAGRFDQDALLSLLNSTFELPGQFGFEVLKEREPEFYRHPGFMGRVLNCNNASGRQWALAWINRDLSLYIDDLEFAFLLLFNTRKENDSWISEVLEKASFTIDRVQAILGKAVTELLHLPNTPHNNELAKNAIRRLQLFAGAQLEDISWSIVGQLISAPLEAGKILAGDILIRKSAHTSPTEIPVSLTALFLKSELQEVRQKGLQLLSRYPDPFLVENVPFVLELSDSTFPDVLKAGLDCIHRLPSLGDTAIHHLAYTLIRKEQFEGAHAIIGDFIGQVLRPYWDSGLSPRDVTKLTHGPYRIGQMMGYEILKAYEKTTEFSMGQIVSFGSHEVLAVRRWCWHYFRQNVDRIRQEKGKALGLLDSVWDDSRAFAFDFFGTAFSGSDWDADTLISIVDSIRPDVEGFGKELITRHFNPDHALDFLTRLSEHPSVNVQAFVTNYLSLYASDKPELLLQLDFYFRSVLTRVNKARVAKNRVFDFLHQEALKSEATAKWVTAIVDEVAAQDTIQDKATCIHILTQIKNRYPDQDMHLVIKN